MANNPGENIGLAVSEAVANAVERAGQVTVLVNARRRLPLSGLLIAPDQVLTASHGVERETDIQVFLPDGSEAVAALAGRDSGVDLAVLKLQTPTGLVSGAPVTAPARVGNLVAAVARPSTEGVQASFGLVTAVGGDLRTGHGALIQRYLVTDAVPYPGFSGGPLVDLGGRVLGMNTSGLVRGMSLAIPADAAFETARVLAEHGHIRRGYLGIRSQVVELPAQAREALGRAQETGLLVVGVETDGPAAGGGLMVGDILVGLNGQPVSDHDELLSRLAGDVVGRPSAIEVVRGGQVQSVTVNIGEKS
jgi:S1-C subfamily serine protease